MIEYLRFGSTMTGGRYGREVGENIEMLFKAELSSLLVSLWTNEAVGDGRRKQEL